MWAPPDDLGAVALPRGRTSFRVWAPRATTIDVHILEPRERVVRLERHDRGVHHALADDVPAGATYFYRLDGADTLPDPVSRCQPLGVTGPSRVVDLRYRWHDGAWRGLPLSSFVLYEIHVGTFTPEGTFDAIVSRLDALRELGITAIELLPVAQFPGERNWGYDGVFPFAVHSSYGGPEGMQRLVDACHARGMAIVLDVVYNHFGPEGGVHERFGPYFSETYRTPWGRGLNFDGPESDAVREHFIQNALQWLRDFHVDALRLDATESIFDRSPVPFLAQLQTRVQDWAERERRLVHLIVENDLNDPRILRPRTDGGLGLSAQWNDDFHHALHALLTDERDGYYADFGKIEHLVRALRQGYVYSGQYSQYRRRIHGGSPAGLECEQFVVYSQNHDQVGNRADGERLVSLAGLEAHKLAVGAVVLSPYLPLLFMGEEYGETAPFHYFTSHAGTELADAVRRGRRAEFEAFEWGTEPPDPQDPATFARSKLHWAYRTEAHHALLLAYSKAVLGLRHSVPALRNLARRDVQAMGFEPERVLCLLRWKEGSEAVTLFGFDREAHVLELPIPPGTWHRRLDSTDACWQGPGSALPEWITSDGRVRLKIPPMSCAVYVRV